MKETALVLRTCNADMSSHGGFMWPQSGHVSAPDWEPTQECGNGLHGFLWGEGNGSLASFEKDAKWLVVEVKTSDIVDLSGKVKFPEGNVVFCGDQYSATEYLRNNGGQGRTIIGGTCASGDYGTSLSGYGGTSTSGNYGTSTSGNYGTSLSGYGGTSTSGNYGTSTSGDGGTSTSGYRGTSISGNYGTSTSGDWGTSTSGDWSTSTSEYKGTSTSGYEGTSTSGDWGTSTSGEGGTSTSRNEGISLSGDGGTSTSGYGGTSTSGNGGTSTSGEYGKIVITWHDGKRYRLAVGYVGEDGIEANVPYVVVDGKLVKKVSLI